MTELENENDTPTDKSSWSWEKNPVRILLGGLAAVINLGLIAAKGLNWLDWTTEQIVMVIAFVSAVLALTSEVIRAAVTPKGNL